MKMYIYLFLKSHSLCISIPLIAKLKYIKKIITYWYNSLLLIKYLKLFKKINKLSLMCKKSFIRYS